MIIIDFICTLCWSPLCISARKILRTYTEFGSDVCLQEMKLLAEVDRPGSRIDRYVSQLNYVLSRKAAGIFNLQARLTRFQRHLKEQEILSRTSGRQPWMFMTVLPPGDCQGSFNESDSEPGMRLVQGILPLLSAQFDWYAQTASLIDSFETSKTKLLTWRNFMVGFSSLVMVTADCWGHVLLLVSRATVALTLSCLLRLL